MSVAAADTAPSDLLDDPLFVRAPDVLWRTIPGVAVVVLRDLMQKAVVLTGTGLALWEELAQPRSVEEVATTLAARYDAAPDVVVLAVTDALAELHTRGLVRHHGS